MKLIVPLAITDALLESTIPMEGMAYTWSSVIDFGSEPVLVAESFSFDPAEPWYRNISTGSNLNHDPSSSPAYWEAYPNPMWDLAETYDFGDEVLHYLGAGYEIAHWWRSKAGSNLNHEPPDDPATADDWWEFVDYAFQRWGPGISSADGVVRNYRGYLYEALTTNSARTAPPDDGTNWLLSDATNRFKALDNKSMTQTQSTADFTYVLAVAGRVDTIGLLELDNITSVNVTMMDGVTEIHNEDYSLLADDVIVDWYEYFFEAVSFERELHITGLPTNLNPTVIISFTGTGTRKVGHITVGSTFEIGDTQVPGEIGIDDRSRIETDEFGNRVVVERGYSRWGKFNVLIDKVKQPSVFRMLAQQRASPALFIPVDDLTATYIFGFPINWAISMPYPNHFMVNMSIEGL